jgi:hypothetical protein
MDLTNDAVEARRDERYGAECRATSREDCMRYGDLDDVCTGCPAWESLKARVEAALAAETQP